MTALPTPHQTPTHTIRRLGTGDAVAFRDLRIEALANHPREFRVAPEDEAETSLAETAELLERDHVIGGFTGERLEGVAGLRRESGSKRRHTALLWGMCVRPTSRGTGLAAALVEGLLAHASEIGVRSVRLTVVVTNGTARRLYERWEFTVYGVEPAAVRVGDDYLDEVLMVKVLS